MSTLEHKPDDLLAELRGDPEFQRTLDLVASEVARAWRFRDESVRDLALSAIGEPNDLLAIHAAWSAWKRGEKTRGYAKGIVRNLLINLLAQDARRPRHFSLEAAIDPDDDPPLEASFQGRPRTPQRTLEDQQLVDHVGHELDRFAARGKVQAKRATLLRLRFYDGLSYRALSRKLGRSENSLRNQVFKATAAFLAHVRRYRPELVTLL